MKHVFLAYCFIAVSGSAYAELKGISFSHKDWEIYCSNTGACKAAGYQKDDDDDKPASLLLFRKAGRQQPVTAEFALSDQDDNMPADTLKNIHFYLNDKDLGDVAAKAGDALLMGKLTQQQVSALLQHSQQDVRIAFKNNHYQWTISDAGMTAALLKMDDFQKRVGTIDALVKKGNADESGVLPAQPKLIVQHVKTASEPYLTLHPQSEQYKAVYRILMAAQPNPEDSSFCEGVYSDENDEPQPQIIEMYKLTNKSVLAKTLCGRGAYNENYGTWVLDESLIGKAVFVTESASDFDSGIIKSIQKGRGLGDCWSIKKWIWNGKQFIQTEDRWSGMCKNLAAGGVWDLDQIEAIIK